MSLCDRNIRSFVSSGFSNCRTQQLVWVAAQGTNHFSSQVSNLLAGTFSSAPYGDSTATYDTSRETDVSPSVTDHSEAATHSRNRRHPLPSRVYTINTKQVRTVAKW